MTPAPGGAPAGKAPPKGGGIAWLKSREGKIAAGAGAVLLVVVMALRKSAGGGGEGFAAGTIQPSYDGTLQGQLDQITGRGGTIDEWNSTASGLSGSIEHLTDLLEAQDPANKPSNTTGLQAQITRLGTQQQATQAELNRYTTLRNALLNNIRRSPRPGGRPTAQAVAWHHQVKDIEARMRPLQTLMGTLNATINGLKAMLGGS